MDEEGDGVRGAPTVGSGRLAESCGSSLVQFIEG